MTAQENNKRILVGVIIMLFGGIILLRSFGIYEDFINEYIFRWEMILVAVGLINIVAHGGRGPGFIMLFVGIALIARHYVTMPNINFWQLFLAFMFIMAGFFLIFKRKGHYECKRPDGTLSDVDSIDEVAVFGGGDRTIVTDSFKGGKILAIFGGSNFNLMRSNLAPGKNYLDLLIIFGGMKLVVPEDWNVKIEAVSIFGGFTDKHRVSTPVSGIDGQSELIIKGLVIFGGGEIKSY
jgi:predicted membrane protein